MTYPKDWKVQKLKEIGEVKGGKRLPKGEPFAETKTPHPYLRVIDFKNNGIDESNLEYVSDEVFKKIKNYTISSNDVYISIAGTIGIVGLIPSHLHGASLTENAAKITNLKNITKEYLSVLLSSKPIQDQIKSYLGTTTQPKLALFRIEKLELPIPIIPEQQKIVSILSNIDSLISSYNKTIESSKKLKQGLMQQLLTKGIGHKKFKKVKWLFGKEITIPEEWLLKKIKELTKVSVGLVINPSTYFDDKGTVPMITGKHVTENGITLDDVDFITEKSNKLLETTRIWSGDLVTMRVGYPGRTSVVKNEHDGINCASVIITRKSKKILSDFLGYLTNSKLISKQIIMHQAGGAQQVVNVGSWKEFLIPFPPPSEQQKIVSIISSIDDKISELESKKSNLDKIKKGLMQKLLTGQIRVKI